jgi:YD repeat-containing protein
MPDGVCPRCTAADAPSPRPAGAGAEHTKVIGIAATVLIVLISVLVHIVPRYLTDHVVRRHRREALARLVRQHGPVVRPDELTGKGRIYLIQLGPHTAPYALALFAQWLYEKYALQVEVLPSTTLDPTAWDSGRKQYIAELLNAQMRREHPALEADPDAYLIGFTDANIYAARRRWNSTFTWRDQPRTAIISTDGMQSTFFERLETHATTATAATAQFQERLRRILLKDVAILYWHLPLNNDPASLLHDTLDPDLPTEELYVSDLDPARTRWGRVQSEPCLFLRYSAKVGVQPLPGNLVRDCSADGGMPQEESHEIFEVDLRLGLLVDRHTDLMIPDSIPIRFERATRSGWTRSMPFGFSGTDSYDNYLASDDMRTIDVIQTDGGRTHLSRTPFWLSSLSLVKYVDRTASDSYLQLRWRTNLFEHFDLTYYDGSVESYLPCDNRVVCYQVGYRNAQGRQLDFQRDGHRRLIRLTSPNRSWLALNYDAGNRIANITDSKGRTVHYTYNDRGQLTTVTYPSGEVLSYTYDTTQHLLTFSVAPNAATPSRLLLTNAYEGDKLVRQVLADGSTYTYVYSPEKGNTIRAARVHDPTGRTFQISVGEDSSLVWQVDPPALPAHRSAHTASASVGSSHPALVR